MKGILEFELPEDGDGFLRAVQAADYEAALIEMREYLRTGRKYSDPRPDLIEIELQFFRILADNGLDI